MRSDDTVFRVIPVFLGALLGVGYAACSSSPGQQVYLDSGCARCHGANFSGTRLGPPLAGLRVTWGREELVRFLKDPSAYTRRDPRLKALAARYQVSMPKFAMEEKTRLMLAEFLLAETE